MSSTTPPPGGTGDGPEERAGGQPGGPPPADAPGQEPAWQQPTAGEPAPGGRQPAPAGSQPSSVGKRVGAYLIDAIGLGILLAIIILPIFVAMGIMSGGRAFSMAGGFGAGWVASLVSSAIFLAYFVVMEGTRGQTVGKMLLSMKVYNYDGSPMDYEGAFKRRFWFVIGPILPIPVLNSLVGIGILIWLLVTMSNDQLNRGYHDVFADSIVVDTQ